MKNAGWATLVVALVAPAAWSQNNQPWPPGRKAFEVSICEATAISTAKKRYMERNNLTELPPNIEKRLESATESILAMCKCSNDAAEKKFSLEYMAAHQEEVREFMRVTSQGACELKLTKPAAPGAAAKP